ncbi:hypothetical protein ROZALSC1DRAFT_27237, partial [Rozella allomycis CSF55]
MSAEGKRSGSAEKKGEDNESGSNNVPVEAIPLDPRVDWFSERVLTSLRLKTEKWKKMTTVKESAEAIVQFMDQIDVPTLLFTVNAKEEIVPCTRFPEVLKKKSIYFMKKPKAPSPLVAPFEQYLIWGEVPAAPLEFLATMLDEIYGPMLVNPKNLETWPQVVAHDMNNHFHQLQSNVYVIAGQTKGKTLLPIPQNIFNEAGEVVLEKNVLHTIESAVIEWTHQIHIVVKSNSASLNEDSNPGPMVEIEFWAAKFANLKSISQQLNSEKIQKVAKILEESNSTYYPAFRGMCDKVSNALDEAQDINTYLQAFKPHAERLNGVSEFAEIANVLPALFHVVGMVWKLSRHYSNPTRMQVLIHELCNDIIEQARTFIQPEDLFKNPPEEASLKLKTVLRKVELFKFLYDDQCKKMVEIDKPWNFDTRLIFFRMDGFYERIENILELFDTIAEFNRLEKIEIGGSKGKILSSQIVQIFTEFSLALANLAKIKYDILNLKTEEFDVDLKKFHRVIEDLDKRLGTVLCQAFDDCCGLIGCFKLLDTFSGLLNREHIQRDFENKYFDLLKMFEEEIGVVTGMFLRQRENPPIHYNMPPIAGALTWTHELKDRLTKSMEKLTTFTHPILTSSEEAIIMRKKYQEVLEMMDQHEQGVYGHWSGNIVDDSEENLGKPLLFRDEKNLLKVNFDPKVVALLKEVKYFNALTVQVPEKASNVYSKQEELREFQFNLEFIVNQYNTIQTTMLQVEQPLIQSRLEAIDSQFEDALNRISWKSSEIGEYIKSIGISVGNLANIQKNMKSNVDQIQKIMKRWNNAPLIERKDTRKPLNVDERDNKLNATYEQIRQDGENIHKLIQETLNILQVDPEGEAWKNYLIFVDNILLAGLQETVKTSLQYLLNNMDQEYLSNNELYSLFESKLELGSNELIFTPPMEEEVSNGFMSIIQALLSDIYKINKLIKPVTGKDVDYMIAVTASNELEEMRSRILDKVRQVLEKCHEYKETFDQFAYLWIENRQDFLKQFVKQLKQKFVQDGSPEEDFVAPLYLDQFEQQIKKYEDIHKTVMSLEGDVTFYGWFKIDAKPLKQALNLVVKKWSYTLSKYLSDETIKTLNELNSFIKSTKKGLQVKPVEGDYSALVASMGLLLAVKHRSSIDNLFEPLRKTVNLLKHHGVDTPEEVFKFLSDLPEEWSDVKKMAVAMRDYVAPLQAQEVDSLQKKCNTFEYKMHLFREEFRNKAPFKFDVGIEKCYELIDQCHVDVLIIESEAAAMKSSADLFELVIPSFKQLGDCRRDIGMLKSLWDLISMVTYLFNEWKSTLWNQIDTDALEIRCRDLMKELRKFDKEIKGWDAFNGLDQMVKDMITSLRAVGELRSNAIRDRHWKQLMKTTGVTFTLTTDMKFQDLLSLQLHKYEDDVKGIVDRATKELSMEKVLGELEKTWNVMEFTYEVHDRTKTPLLKSSEELIEILEDNQVLLQNMMTSKYVAYFLETISKWQNILSTVDTVVTLWLEVQKTWSHLENIFIGSEDIRTQLPEDTKRFDGIDSDYKKLMAEASKTPKTIEVCLKPSLFETLESLQGQLALCEKSLAEYLETKRLAFPRFYFISSSDLLDILARGNQPQAVAIHLPKLFDNLAGLKFKGGADSKTAIGMFSKEDEYVEFSEECECVGPVEVWLNRVVDVMRKTLRHLMSEAVVTYEEKPREQWLFDYPAQISLAGTQIWWTTEVNAAFARLEEGYENSLKDYYKKQVNQLTALITLIQGELTKGNRQMIMTICTLDVHARDIVAKLISEKADNAQCFNWQCQLRLKWDEEQTDCIANICDASFRYSYEYLGNTPRLVVTPLTDRCYITLTQSIHLIMGGAPAGPAGTGKTETVKDLGRALAIMVYVFNCSEQMDYKSIGNIFKGLSQSGTWGCFDEFNRIAVEVLSVVGTQVKSIQDALRAKKKRFVFQGEEISLCKTVSYYITMNPGYAGRAELPENLKALFRPCSMVVPDLQMICEIMLMAEGFLEASTLARKFTTLYRLNRELLSKQDHYDWGLRAIKSVLVVAGGLKRSEPGVNEEHVLMRALRDFNLPKIVTDDLPVFNGLISDLFPKIDIPRKRNEQFEDDIRKATIESGLQTEENFILKVVQLEELLAVRHCVFVLGNAGTGKSQVWKTLAKTYNNMGKKCVYSDLNPKAVTTDELFGCINPATREWKDGLFSTIMRDMSSIPNTDPKWIVLDGDIDPQWIESLNTVMDDNKILTLASNERIPLKPHMRLLFEISDLKYATPATVSRAGILYINPTDLGWSPYVQSWLEKREDAAEKSNLTVLFDRYVNPCLDVIHSKRFKCAPVEDFSMVQTLCSILEALLTPKNTPKGCDKEWFEIYFVFAAVWAFGGIMYADTMVDYRVEFSKWWNTEFKLVKFPPTGTVFDYYVDNETKKFMPWADKVPSFTFDPEVPLQNVLVNTVETYRTKYLLDLLADNGKPVLLIGPAGSGKTVLMQDKLAQYGEDRMIVNISFNFYTTSLSLQQVLEKPLEKKAGRNYGPPGQKKLIYFLDDLNMPEVDKYGTAQPHTILRQHLDYKHWYDRSKLTLKEIHNCQYVACMNPTAGSFTITSRLQRHFSTFSVNFPAMECLTTIYNSILSQFLRGFGEKINKSCDRLVNGIIALHKKVASVFLPTAVKFHYVFNLRDLSSIIQGILFAQTSVIKEPIDLIRLWLHESTRVYGDKLVNADDRKALSAIQAEIIKKSFEEMDQKSVFAEPLVFSHFAGGLSEPKYMSIKDWASYKKILEEALEQYQEANAAMDLVLFEDAMSHISRVSRILESPRGNGLLIGVGGSGKQSLARLAAFMSGKDIFQITLKKGYSSADLKLDLAMLYQKTGIKKQGVVFLLTDSQIADERFLVLINDLLASGNIPGLFPDEDYENIINAMRNEVKALGLIDTREACWDLFIKTVRKNLKVVLCFSPVGSALRNRCRKFPAIVNCTMIDWFSEWPQEALLSVAQRFIDNCDLVPQELKESVTKFMAFAHQSVNDVSKKYLENDKRYNYTTPKSFLELINLYKIMLEKKSTELLSSMERLENGLAKLQSTASQVDDLKAKLASQEVELRAKNEEANRLIERVAIDTEKVNKEKAIADEEERKVDAFAKEVAEKQRQCAEDLRAAEPALAAAEEALNTLNKANLTELKSFGSPTDEIKNVVAAVIVLLSPPGKIAKDRSWKAGKAIMAKVDQFLETLIKFDKENIDKSNLEALAPYLSDPNFNTEFIKTKSAAAAGLCGWVINIVKYFEVYCDVEPKRKALEQANLDLSVAQNRLAEIQNKIMELNKNLSDLKAKFEKATADKLRCEEEAKRTQETIILANRLVGGLASENVRWAISVDKFKEQQKTLTGDVLLAAAFLSYVGCFTKKYRTELITEKWLPFLNDPSNNIPMSSDIDALKILTNDAEIAKWCNEGLPNDRVSLENATIFVNCKRWPLIIDPQLQGIRWVKNREKNLRIVRLGQRGYLDVIEKAVSSGDVVLLEDIGVNLDPVLDALIGRNTIKKGKYIKIGDKEVEYDSNFRLILQTRIANPHYPPEIQAQTSLINFTVTIAGLEDQLLADVVNSERPELERTKAELTKQQNEFKIKLTELEDSLLSRLSAAEGNFLGDYALVENLETTKRTATEIEVKVEEAKKTEKKINETRELYRPVAARSSLLYFLLNDLNQINPMYQYSLNAFKVVFQAAINSAEKSEELKERVFALIDNITFSVFKYTTRGLFERDKLIFVTQMTFSILKHQNDIDLEQLDFLLRGPVILNVNSPVEWLNNNSWGMVKALSNLDSLKILASDIENSSKRWKKYCEHESPENEKLPQEWKNKTALEKLCIIRALRPDRLTYAVRNFVKEKMGTKYIDSTRVPLKISFQESSPGTPIFFILSPGVDPVKEVEELGLSLNFTEDNGKFYNISLGQGQEVIAEQKLDLAYKDGGWVMLQNIHLTVKWLPTLEKKLESLSQNSHPDFRVFLSAEPSADPAFHVIPTSILQSSIKITNEPPTGMNANIHRALDNFKQETLEMCSKESEFKTILFSLCYFHAVVLERRKFGTQGWNKGYPFNTGDLTISVNVLYNYLEASVKVPWVDLRYIFGEIMYGGHISDDWDRRLCSAYLETFVNEQLFEGAMEFAPGFPVPPPSDYKEYHRYIDDQLPPETPYLYGLHPNAEIDVLTKTADKLFKTILEMQPQETAGGSVVSREEKVKQILDDIIERLPES